MAAFAWHVHHDRLMEPLTDPIAVRRVYIGEYKPKEEQELRLRLLTEVKGEMPAEVVDAWDAFEKANDAYYKARDTYDKTGDAYNRVRDTYYTARAAYDKAMRDHKGEIEELHRQECPDCPWNGKTIFPEEARQ